MQRTNVPQTVASFKDFKWKSKTLHDPNITFDIIYKLLDPQKLVIKPAVTWEYNHPHVLLHSVEIILKSCDFQLLGPICT